VVFPIRPVFHHQGGVLQHPQVLGIPILGRLREVEAAGDDDGAVDAHDFVVGDGDLDIGLDRDAGVGEIGGCAVTRMGFALPLCPCPATDASRLRCNMSYTMTAGAEGAVRQAQRRGRAPLA